MQKTVTVRIPEEMHRECQRLSRRRKVSMNSFLVEGARKMIEEEKRRLLYDAFSEAADEGDVEFASAAQREILNDE